MSVVARPISILWVVPTPGPSALTRSKHESRDAIVRGQPFAPPELEVLGALGVTQQPKGAFSLGSPFVLTISKNSQDPEKKTTPWYCTPPPPPRRCPAQRRASNSPPAQLVRMRNHPRLALAKKRQLAQVRKTPQLARREKPLQARLVLQQTPSLAQAKRQLQVSSIAWVKKKHCWCG